MEMDPATGKLTRRAALRMFASAAGVALLAACQAPAGGPSSAPTAAAKPTAPAGRQRRRPRRPSRPLLQRPTAAAAATRQCRDGCDHDAAARAGFLPAGVGATSTAPVTAPKGQPRSGGTLRQGYLGDLPNLDGHWISGQHTIYPIWDRLVDLDSSLQPHPALAESWEVNPDFTQATFHLRKGVTWHTGRDLTSEDIAWNYNRIKSDRKIDGGIKANFFVPLGSIDTPDKNTVVLHATQPWPAIFNVLAWTNLIDPQTPPSRTNRSAAGRFRSSSGSRAITSP